MNNNYSYLLLYNPTYLAQPVQYQSVIYSLIKHKEKAARRVELLFTIYSPTEALINSRNNGCGRCGRDTNSGWN